MYWLAYRIKAWVSGLFKSEDPQLVQAE